VPNTTVYGKIRILILLCTAHRVGYCAKSRIKYYVTQFVIPHTFRYTGSVMVILARRREQRQRYLKTKVAMALYREYSRVPKENEIDEVYHVTRIMKTVLGTPFLRK
jgi:hypothetical protein